MYTVTFTHDAFRKFRGYIDIVENEVSGLAKITLDEFTNEIVVSDLILLPQTVSPALTTMDKNGLDQWYRECMDNGTDPSQYRCWWHSHAKMAVFWSGTDEGTINDLDNEQETGNYFLSVVGNHKGEIKARLDVFKPIRYTLQDLEVQVMAPNDGLREELEAEVKAKVKVETYTPKIITPQTTTKKDNGMKPILKGKTNNNRDDLEVIPIPDEEVNGPGLGNIPEFLQDEATTTKISRLPEADQMKGYYWREYLAGRWGVVSTIEEVTQYGDLRLFQRNVDKDNNVNYIPKPPECKWYKKLIMSELKDMGGLN